MRGADLLVKTLAASGVSRIFSLSGNQIMPIYDACLDAGIEIVHTRHEAAAAYMAEAHAQLTGELGVALVTAGVGAANAVGPLFTAKHSQSPVLLLTGDSPVAQDGKGAFQEFDQVPMTAPATKFSKRVISVDKLIEDVSHAFNEAFISPMGPVHLALPFDVVEAEVEAETSPVKFLSTELQQQNIKGTVDALSAASRPLIICGPALNKARSGELQSQISAALDAPVIGMESPRGLNDPSLGSLASVIGEADLVLLLGKSVDFTLGFGTVESWNKACRWICVNGSAEELKQAERNLGDRMDHEILTDPHRFALELAQSSAACEQRSTWRETVLQAVNKRTYVIDETSLNSGSLCIAVERKIQDFPGAIVIHDGGEFGQWAQSVITSGKRIINGISGAIGGGLCYGLAASKACGNTPVFVLMGDGTSGFHIAEFETAVRENASFVAIIGNDLRWNAEHQIQMREYGSDRLIGCELSGARYDLMVEAMGGHGEYVTDLSQLDSALERSLASGLPSCINVIIEGLPAPRSC